MSTKIYAIDADGLPLKVIASCVPPLPHGLSPVEVSLVEAILAGHPNSKIAADRGVSPRTVANQLAKLYEKTGVASRRELVVRLHQGQGK